MPDAPKFKGPIAGAPAEGGAVTPAGAVVLPDVESESSGTLHGDWVPPGFRTEDREAKLRGLGLAGGVKEMGVDAVLALDAILRDPATKDSLRAEIARWVLEKTTGRAKQEVEVGSQSLGYFIELLKEMRQTGQTLDVTPAAKPQHPGSALLPEGSSLPEIEVPPEDPLKTWFDEET